MSRFNTKAQAVGIAGGSFALATLFVQALVIAFVPIPSIEATYVRWLQEVPAPLAFIVGAFMWGARRYPVKESLWRAFTVFLCFSIAYAGFTQSMIGFDGGLIEMLFDFSYIYGYLMSVVGFPLFFFFGMTGFLLSNMPDEFRESCPNCGCKITS